MGDARELRRRTRWLGHAGFLIQDRLTVYVDPVRLPDGLPPADVVLLTHNHPSHCSMEDVMKVARPQTIVIGPADAIWRFRLNQLVLSAGQTKEVLGMPVTGTAAYTVSDPRHPRGGPGLGFLFELSGVRVLHPGDSDRVPELEGIKTDLALLPVAGNVMAPEEAARLAKDSGATLAVPMHYDGSSRQCAQAFLRAAGELGVAAELLEAPPV